MFKKIKKMFLITTTCLLLTSNYVAAASNLKPTTTLPTGRACERDEYYVEKDFSTYKDQQFEHMAYKSPISSHVTHTVTLTQSLSLSAGVEGDLKLLLAKARVKFELSYVSSTSTTSSITWNVAAGANYKLVAGKEMAIVKGIIKTVYSNCDIRERVISVKGSYRTYSEAIRQ